jgi:3',5'-cyclic AMP phosphodiesterase CpdA
MTRFLLASDLHYVPNLAEEIAVNRHRLEPDTFDHQVEGKLYWHNYMVVEEGERLLDGLERIARQEKPDLLIFLGDMVNVNWEKSIAGVAARIANFPCPVRQVTGNHDIYLDGPENRLQDAVTPGSYSTGLRHEIIDGLGLIYLDLFARCDKGRYRKWKNPNAQESVEYRAQDIIGALSLMAQRPEHPWLLLGHFPFVTPDERLRAPGRKIGWQWPSAEPLATHLQEPNNLIGMICGHQHFAHLQRFANGFHWTLPALVEYPNAAAILDWDGTTLSGRIVTVDEALAAESLRARQESWTAGEAEDQQLVWQCSNLALQE